MSTFYGAMNSEAVIPRLSVPVVIIIKFIIINLLLWPLLEYLHSILVKNEARQAIMKGESIYWTAHKAGPLLLHGKSYNRRSKAIVLVVGVIAILTSFSLEFAFDSKTVTEAETNKILSGIDAFDIEEAESNGTMHINIEAVLFSSVQVLEVSGHTGASIPFSQSFKVKYDKETSYRGQKLYYNSDAMWSDITAPGGPLKLDEQYRPIYDPMVTKNSYIMENVNVTLFGEVSGSERSINGASFTITFERSKVIQFTPRHGQLMYVILDAEGDIIIYGERLSGGLIIHFEGKETQFWLIDTNKISSIVELDDMSTEKSRLVFAKLVVVLKPRQDDFHENQFDINSAVILSGSIKLKWLLSTAGFYELPQLVNEMTIEAVGATMFDTVPNSKFKEERELDTKPVVRAVLKMYVLIPATLMFIAIFICCMLRLTYLKWRYSKMAINNRNEKEVVLGDDFDYAVRLFSSQMGNKLDCYNPARTDWRLGIRRSEDDIDHIGISDLPTVPYLKELGGLWKRIT